MLENFLFALAVNIIRFGICRLSILFEMEVTVAQASLVVTYFGFSLS
jgi:hypothetical protein